MKAVVTAIDGIVEFLIGPARRFCLTGKSAVRLSSAFCKKISVFS
jgi:hypothetical protein